MPRRPRDLDGAAVDRLTLRLTQAETRALRSRAPRSRVAPLVRDALASLGLFESPGRGHGRAVLERSGRGWRVRPVRRSEGAVLFSRVVAGHQVAAAHRLERDQATVSRWASGRNVPSNADRLLVERLFGVPAVAWKRAWISAPTSLAA